MTAPPDRPDPTTARGASTTLEVLSTLAREGYTTQFVPNEDPLALTCGACGARSPADAFAVDRERRLEGASDPGDMALVVALRCPVCGARGALEMGFGPQASALDADLALALG